MQRIVGFPEFVNEKAARATAAVVGALGVVVLVTGWQWLIPVMAVGFAIRVLFGPQYSPISRFASAVIAPRLGAPIKVAGAPKRFAQGVGLAFTVAASVAAWAGASGVAFALIAVLVLFAGLEAIFGFCAGCFVYGYLIRVGIAPEAACEACSDISLRRPATAASNK